MTTVKKLMAAASEFTDRNGNKKKNWIEVGKQIEMDDGRKFITLHPHINLAGFPVSEKGGVMVSIFEDKPQEKDLYEKGNAGKKHYDTMTKSSQRNDFDGDDLPF